MSRNLPVYKYFSLILNSNFHTSCYLHVAPRQAGNFMNKVLGSTKKKKLHYSESPNPNVHDAFTKSPTGSISTNPRRVTVLNKLFMRNITDLMSTEAYSSQILGLGVEINRVKMTPDYKILKVYWTTKSSQQEEAEKVLLKNAGLLRHELSQLRLMGNVPIIQFVKDKHYADFLELNNILAVADYGEEGPSNTDPATHFISEWELSMPIEDDIKTQLAKLEQQNPYEVKEPDLPSMTHCVFNLDHTDIMNRVTKGRKVRNVDASDRTVDENWASFKLSQYSNTEPVALGNAKDQREAFNKFLQQRKILKLKYRQSQNEDLEIEYMREEDGSDKQFEMKEIDEDFIFEDADDRMIKD